MKQKRFFCRISLAFFIFPFFRRGPPFFSPKLRAYSPSSPVNLLRLCVRPSDPALLFCPLALSADRLGRVTALYSGREDAVFTPAPQNPQPLHNYGRP